MHRIYLANAGQERNDALLMKIQAAEQRAEEERTRAKEERTRANIAEGKFEKANLLFDSLVRKLTPFATGEGSVCSRSTRRSGRSWQIRPFKRIAALHMHEGASFAPSKWESCFCRELRTNDSTLRCLTGFLGRSGSWCCEPRFGDGEFPGSRISHRHAWR